MCFSAQASFTAAATLAVIGGFNMRQVKGKRELPLALVPLLFALQQAAEGTLWVTQSTAEPHPLLAMGASYVFLFFAMIFWPFWIPFSVFVLEKFPIRKALIFLVLLGGVWLAGFNLYYGYTQKPDIVIVNHSIQYIGTLPDQRYLYAALVILPTFITSFRNAWQFGVLVSLSVYFSQQFFNDNFVSVWCFFAAIISLWLYKVFRDNRISGPYAEY